MSKAVTEIMSQEHRLRSYILRKGRTVSESQDVVQETLTRVLEQSAKRPIDNPMAYAFRVADSVMAAQGRGHEARAEALDEDLRCEAPLADDILEHNERARLLRDVLSRLSETRREVFLKRNLEGKSRQVIADEMNMSVEAVKKYLVRAMAEISLALDDAASKRLGGRDER